MSSEKLLTIFLIMIIIGSIMPMNANADEIILTHENNNATKSPPTMSPSIMAYEATYEGELSNDVIGLKLVATEDRGVYIEDIYWKDAVNGWRIDNNILYAMGFGISYVKDGEIIKKWIGLHEWEGIGEINEFMTLCGDATHNDNTITACVEDENLKIDITVRLKTVGDITYKNHFDVEFVVTTKNENIEDIKLFVGADFDINNTGGYQNDNSMLFRSARQINQNIFGYLMASEGPYFATHPTIYFTSIDEPILKWDQRMYYEGWSSDAFSMPNNEMHLDNVDITISGLFKVTMNSNSGDITIRFQGDDRTLTPGLDVSHYQGKIDWERVANDGYKFAIIKATEGTTFTDERWEENVQGARDTNILVGLYHFARPGSSLENPLENDAVDEAKHFLNTVEDYLPGSIGMFLDIEVGCELGKEELSNWILTWTNYIETNTHVKPIIYTSESLYNDCLTDKVKDSYDMWIARIGTKDFGSNPGHEPGLHKPLSGKPWTFWQFSFYMCINGIQSYETKCKGTVLPIKYYDENNDPITVEPVAGDFFNGDLQQLNALVISTINFNLPNSNGISSDGTPTQPAWKPFIIEVTFDECEPNKVVFTIKWEDNGIIEEIWPGGNIVRDGNTWRLVLEPPFPSSRATVHILIDCPNNDFEDERNIIFIDPSGTITESCTNGPLEGATVTLYREFPEGSGNFVIPAPSDHIPTTNPQVTGSDGRYGWLTVAGTYKILVEKDGYNPEWSVEVTVPPPVNNLNVELDRTNGCDFGTLTAIPNPIPTPGSSTDLTLTMESSGLGNTVITAWVVYEPDEDICQVVLLPSPIPPGGSVTKTYPDDFTISVLDDSGTGNNTCDTDTIGAYTTEVQTEIGDPIIKTFYIAFNVLNEAVIGSVALVGASLAAIIAYAYRKKSI